MVRRMPTLPLSMRSAAPIPVSNEICAFQSSEASSGRKEMRKPPLPSSSISCSGIGSVAPPRSRSSSTRFLADLLEQDEALLGAAVVDRPLHLGVVVTAHAAHHRAVDLDRGASPSAASRRSHTKAGRTWSGRRLAALAELAGMQLHALVGAVDGLTATSRLPVEGAAGPHEGRHVGDRVTHR